MQTQRCPVNQQHVSDIDKDSDLEHGGQRGSVRENEKSCPLRDQRPVLLQRAAVGGGGRGAGGPVRSLEDSPQDHLVRALQTLGCVGPLIPALTLASDPHVL